MLIATGAPKVDILGHSEGSTLPRVYFKYNNGDAKTSKILEGEIYAGSSNFNMLTVVRAVISSLVLSRKIRWHRLQLVRNHLVEFDHAYGKLGASQCSRRSLKPCLQGVLPVDCRCPLLGRAKHSQ